MLSLAGPIFTEWYWGPIFFGIFVIVPAVAVAAVTTALAAFIARGRNRKLSRPTLAVVFVAVTAYFLWSQVVEMEMQQDYAESSGTEGISRPAGLFTFQPYSPVWLPPGSKLKTVDAAPHLLVLTYESTSGTAQVRQSADVLGGEGFFYCPPETRDSPSKCRVIKTPSGRRVVVSASKGEYRATRAIETTVIELLFTGWTDEEIGRYFDSLRPADSLEIDEFE